MASNMLEEHQRKRVRKRTVTDAEKKRKKQIYAKEHPFLTLGKEHVRWRNLKMDIKCKSDENLATLLLDCWYNRETLFCKKCGAVVKEKEVIYPVLYSRNTSMDNQKTPDVNTSTVVDNESDADEEEDDTNNERSNEDGEDTDVTEEDVRNEEPVINRSVVSSWKDNLRDDEEIQTSDEQALNKQKVQSEKDVLNFDTENKTSTDDAIDSEDQVDLLLSDHLRSPDSSVEPSGILIENQSVFTNKNQPDFCLQSADSVGNAEMYMQIPVPRHLNADKLYSGNKTLTINSRPLQHVLGIPLNVPFVFQAEDINADEEKSKESEGPQTESEEEDCAKSKTASVVIKVEPDEPLSDNDSCTAQKFCPANSDGILDLSCSNGDTTDPSDTQSSDHVPVKSTRTRRQVSRRGRRRGSKVLQTGKVLRKRVKQKYDEDFFGKAKSMYLEQTTEGVSAGKGEQSDSYRRRSGRLKEKGKICFTKMMQYEHNLCDLDEDLSPEEEPEDAPENKKDHTTDKNKGTIVAQKSRESPRQKVKGDEARGRKSTEELSKKDNHFVHTQAKKKADVGDKTESDIKTKKDSKGGEKVLITDPDFEPSSEENVSSESGSESDGNSEDDDEYKPGHSDLNNPIKVSNKKSKEEPVRVKRKYTKRKGLEPTIKQPKKRRRLNTKPKKAQYPNIEVKLDAHTDKFERTVFTSHAKSDRCVDEKLKSYERYTCKLCNGDFNTTDEPSMENHIKLHLQGRLSCKDCGITFSRLKKLQVHRTKFHSEETFMCEHCAKDFGYLKTLQRHLARDHGENPYCCTKCAEKFISHEARKLHMYEKHPGSAVKCDKCGEVFLGRALKKEHVGSTSCLRRAKEIPQETQCEHCGKMITTNTLAAHVRRAHHKIHVHRCELCPYTTNSEYNIIHHRMTHTGERPHRCDLCNFSCIYICQLKSHMRTHTGDKPYKCDQCSYASAWNVQLKGHKKAHESLTKVDCQKCNITFKDEKGLGLHNKKEHLQSDWSVGSVPETSFVPMYRPLIKHEGAHYS